MERANVSAAGPSWQKKRKISGEMFHKQFEINLLYSLGYIEGL
jgi:hypothetical protein